jgi:hypothetical protein
MNTNEADDFSDGSDRMIVSPFPEILLAGDNVHAAESMHRKLFEEGFAVQLAPSYRHLETLWQQHRHPVILLDVSSVHAVDAAVDTALRIKRRDLGQFIGYLADPILRTSGLAGDAIFPRNIEPLSEALRMHFSRQSRPEA